MLAQLLAPLKGMLVVVGDFRAEADLFGKLVLGANWKGSWPKRLASPYTPGVVSPDRRKLKRPGWQEGRIWRE